MYKKGDFKKALEFYNQAGIEKPDLPEIRYNLGNSLHQQKEWERALQNYQKALQGTPDPSQAQIYYNLGNTFYRLDKYPEAIEAYKKCLGINPNDEDAKYNLEYVRKKLQEKKQPQSKNQKNKDKQKQNQQAQNPDDKNQKQNQPQKQEEQKQNPQPKEQNQQQLAQKPPGGISKEEADRILDALQDKERENKKKNRKIFKTPKTFTGKDW